MTKTSPSTGLAWVNLNLPAHHYAITIIQQILCTQAKSWCFETAKIQQMELAVEEAITTILQLIHGDGVLDIHTPSAGHFDVKISALENALQLRITDYDLPYDLSMIPFFSPSEVENKEDNMGLSFYLLRQMVDGLRVHHPGINGQSLELEWYFTAGQLSQQIEQKPSPHIVPTEAVSQTIQIRALQDQDAIYLARLMHQNYGYSYVNPDLYIAERICLRRHDGRLTSVVALDETEQLVGHCALMKSEPNSTVVELGAAVVSPNKQGLGIFNMLWQSLEDQLPNRQEQLACVHAVTCHPYTQKTVLRHDYVISGLMLGYTPTSIQFKSVSNQNNEERGSVYYCCKLLKPSASLDVYLPKEDKALVLRLAKQLQMPLHCIEIDLPPQDKGISEFNYVLETSLNSVFLTCENWSSDGPDALRKLWKYLCRERIDVIYISIDLTQTHAPILARYLRELGFISGGFVPYMPYPATLLLQYLNNQKLTENSIFAVGDNATTIKNHVFTAYKKQELLDEFC